jgi:hypothetical protein
MLCPDCHGKGLLQPPAGPAPTPPHPQPCPGCGGVGVVHCCEGLQAQPEPPFWRGTPRPAGLNPPPG